MGHGHRSRVHPVACCVSWRSYCTLPIVHSLTDAGIEHGRADAIASAVAAVADHGDPVTKPALDAALVPLRSEIAAAIAASEARIYRAMLVQTLAIVGGVAAILRLLG